MSAIYPRVFDRLDSPLSAEQKACYEQDGLLAVRQLLTAEQVAEARTQLTELVRRFRGEALAGHGQYTPPSEQKSNYAGASIRLADSKAQLQFEPGVDPLTLNDDQADQMFRNIYHYHQEHSFFTELVASEAITGVVRQLIGEEGLLFQSMALSKPARIGGEKPWHQDDAYFVYAPLNKIVGVWIALDDAAAANGCMHVLPGWHHRGALKHTHTFDCQIMPDRMSDAQPQAVELPPGGAMFFVGLLPHQTPPNRSDRRRRALQFHYRGVSTRELDQDGYNRTFAEADGTPASCAVAK